MPGIMNKSIILLLHFLSFNLHQSKEPLPFRTLLLIAMSILNRFHDHEEGKKIKKCVLFLGPRLKIYKIVISILCGLEDKVRLGSLQNA